MGIIGAIRVPPTVTAAIEAKIEANQRATQRENEVREAEAAANKSVAEAEGARQVKIKQAEGEAEANRKLAQSITPQLIQWRKLEIQQTEANKWNGTLPTTVLGGSGAIPLINIGK